MVAETTILHPEMAVDGTAFTKPTAHSYDFMLIFYVLGVNVFTYMHVRTYAQMYPHLHAYSLMNAYSVPRISTIGYAHAFPHCVTMSITPQSSPHQRAHHGQPIRKKYSMSERSHDRICTHC